MLNNDTFISNNSSSYSNHSNIKENCNTSMNKSNFSESINEFPFFIASLIYIINETKILDKYISERNNIEKYIEKESYKCFYSILDALDCINNIEKNSSFKIFALNIQNLYKEEITKKINKNISYNDNCNNSNTNNSYDKNINSNSSSNANNHSLNYSISIDSSISNSINSNTSIIKKILIFDYEGVIQYLLGIVIYQNIKNISIYPIIIKDTEFNNVTNKERKKKFVIKIEENSEEEAIQSYENEMEDRQKYTDINIFHNLFLSKILLKNSNNKFEIKKYCQFYFQLKEILGFYKLENIITLNDCFKYFYDKKGKIYISSEFIFLNFGNESNNCKINYGKEFYITLYNGEKVPYRLGGIIVDHEEDNNALISENLDGIKWKIYNRNLDLKKEVQNLNLSLYSNPTLLIYKKNLNH